MIAGRTDRGGPTALITLALAALIGAACVRAQGVAWRSGASDLPSATVENARAALRRATSSTHVVVQFAHPLSAPLQAHAADCGLRLLRPLGANAWFARVECGVAAEALVGLPGLTGISRVLPEWKLHPVLRAGQPPDWSIIGAGDMGTRGLAAYVVFHADVPLANEAVPLVESYGGAVQSRLPSINGLVLVMDEQALIALAAEDSVQWIEPPLPPLGPSNDGARAATGADLLQAPPYGLDGAHITVLVFDGGTARSTHVDFSGRLTVLDTSGTIAHATHVAGTIGGAGVANPLYRGMAPAVTLLSYGLQVGGAPGFLYTDPGDLEADYDRAIHDGGALISNNSIGSNVEGNGFDCAWQGDYGVTDALIDAIVGGSLGAPFRVIWAGGNERSGSRCDVEGFDDYYSIAPPSGAKNHISVGALNSNDDSMTTFSSWGPTDDGRLKPDICAPGCQVGGDFGIRSCSSNDDTSYVSMCGTSMACPVVCGLSALVLQDFQTQFPGQPLPRNATLKALWAQTAADLGNPGPDYQSGYGKVRAQAAVDLLRTGAFVEAFATQDSRDVRTVDVAPGTAELKVTLAWDDEPATPNVAAALVNDLDLWVTGPDGTRYYPWNLNPQDPAAPADRIQEDHTNNIEQVLVDSPQPGTWIVEVVGHNVPAGPQSYSLAGDGAHNVATVISFPDGRPDVVPAGQTFDLAVRILAFGQQLVSGTAQLHWRTGNGAFEVLPVTDLGEGEFRALLPAANCGQVPQYYFTVQTTEQGTVALPPAAPGEPLTHAIGVWATLFEDQFELDSGWSVYAGAISGNWERADPQQVINMGVITQPEDDHTPDPGHLCYVTGAAAGAHPAAQDVDGGPSHLTSPVLNLSGMDAFVSYWRWFHISIQMDDMLEVSVTPDGVNWVPVEEVSRSDQVWQYAGWRINDFITPTATTQVRFTVNDTDPGSLMEALIDDFSISYVACQTNIPGDLNCDGSVNVFDIDPFVMALTDPGGYATIFPSCDRMLADCNCDDLVNAFDIDAFVNCLVSGNCPPCE
jgi:hypothetical protein